MPDGQNVKSGSFKHLCINWMLALLTTINNVGGYSMAWPTLYNFVTNPKNLSFCGTPGLGESETVYAIASGSFNGGAVIGGLIATVILTKITDYKRLFTIGPIVQLVGGILYAASTAGWMVIIARLSFGVNYGLAVPTAMSYFTVSSREYNRSRDAQDLPVDAGLKKRLMIIYGFVTTSSYFLLAVLVSLASFVSVLDQFRWIGWFQGGLSILVIFLILCLFNNDIISKEEKLENKERNEKEKQKITCLIMMPIIYVLLAAYLLDSYVATLDTITSQMLNDYFGFSTNYISYFFTGALLVYPLSSVLLLLSQRFKLSSRFVLLTTFVCGTVGIITISDWQSIVSNECNVLSNASTSTQYSTSSICPMDQTCLYAGDIISGNCSLFTANGDQFLYYYKSTTGFVANQLHCPSCSSANCWQYKLSSDDDEICKSTEDKTTNEHILTFPNLFQYQGSNYSACLPTTTPYKYTNESNCTLMLKSIFIRSLTFTNSVTDEQTTCESNKNCYWNQNSIITGEYCADCLQSCNSRSSSIHFSQVCIGLFLVALSSLMGHFIIFPILTKITPTQIQAATTSLTVMTQGLAALVTPIWMSEVYIASGHRTFIAMSVMLLCHVPIYVGYCLFFRLLTTVEYPQKNEHRPSISSVRPLIVEPGIIAEQVVANGTTTYPINLSYTVNTDQPEQDVVFCETPV